LLTINAPIGLNFRDNPGNITNQSVAENPNGETNVTGGNVGLQVNPGQTLALIGGDVLLDDGNLTAKGGRIEIGSVKGLGRVNFNSTENGLVFDYSSINSFGDINLENTSVVDVTAGGGGDIAIAGKNIGINNSSLNAGILRNLGSKDSQAGDITLNATGAIAIDSSVVNNRVRFLAIGNAGNISITTGSLSLTNAVLTTSNAGQGNAGNITVNANDTFSLAKNSLVLSNIGSFNRNPGEGNGKVGNISIEAKEVSLTDTSQLQAGIFSGGRGEAGIISIKAQDSILFNGLNSGIFTDVESGAEGNGSEIQLSANSISLTDGAVLKTSNAGQGNAGNITVNTNDTFSLAKNSFVLSNIGSPNRNPGEGNGKVGNISIEAKEVSLTDTSQLQAGIFSGGRGEAGIISIKAQDSILFNGLNSGIFTDVESGAEGNGSEIQLSANSISLTDGAVLKTSNAGQGNAGNITVQATDLVEVVGVPNSYGSSTFLTADVNSGATGKGGDLTIEAKRLSVRDGGRVSTNNYGVGKAGNLTIEVDNLSVKNSQVSSSTFGKGDAGNLTVNASESVELTGELLGKDGLNGPTGFPGGLFAQVDLNGKGQGGRLTVETERLSISNGSKIQAATFGEGNAGELLIRASNIEVFDTPDANNYFGTTINAGVSRDPRTVNPPKGNGGNLTIETDQLSIKSGGRVTADTAGEGNAGNLYIKANNLVEVVGAPNSYRTFLSAEVKEGATGRGGNLKIEAGQLKIANEGSISVASFDESGTAGNLEINADSIQLERGTITAATSLGEGGNINLNVDDTLTMRDNSRISAQAFGDADGGNININAGFVIAYPSQVPNDGNDIIASAERGDGGNIIINTQQIFGLQERRATPGNGTNDIDASSEFGLSGEVVITNLVDDVNQGVVESPDNVVEPETVTTQACSAEGRVARGESSFTITGRGGLPTLATDPLTSDQISIGGEDEEDTKPSSKKSPGRVVTVTEQPNPPSSKDIVPARGMIVNEKGEVVLTAYPTPNTSQRIPSNLASCERS
jgi:large exoprotein involved in heme utilization and adhesion